MTLIFENEVAGNAEWTDALTDFSPEDTAKAVIREALETVECPYEAQVNLLLTDDASIREMNRQFRGIDKETDVLSFPMLHFETPGQFTEDCFDPESGELLLGDIVISVPRCIAQAETYGHSVRREYAFLVAHSMLHLSGYDHMEPAEEKEMFALQEKILTGMGIER